MDQVPVTSAACATIAPGPNINAKIAATTVWRKPLMDYSPGRFLRRAVQQCRSPASVRRLKSKLPAFTSVHGASPASNPNVIAGGALAALVPGIEHPARFNEQQFDLVLRVR